MCCVNETDALLDLVNQVKKEFCEYNGYIRSRATGGHSGSGRAKHIYRIIVSPKKGVDSLNVEKQIVEDTEKGN